MADAIDGVNLKNHRIGDVIELPPTEARLLLAEEWALPERRVGEQRAGGLRRRREDAAQRGQDRG